MKPIDEQPVPSPTEREDHPDALTYWSKRDRWAALGKKVGELRARAKREGVLLESIPGARALIDAFKAAGKEVDRRVR